MIPHTLVLKPSLVIFGIYNGYWFWGRPSVIDLWHDLLAVTSEIRPDWDLSSPGLREAWNVGDFSRFHGWNKHCQYGNALDCAATIFDLMRYSRNKPILTSDESPGPSLWASVRVLADGRQPGPLTQSRHSGPLFLVCRRYGHKPEIWSSTVPELLVERIGDKVLIDAVRRPQSR